MRITRLALIGTAAFLLAQGVAFAHNPSSMPLPPKTQFDSFGTAWTRIGEDNFTRSAPRGSWASSDANKVVYVGDHGLKWHVYPDNGHCDPSGQGFPHCYMPSKVLSVHNGVLDYWLHDCTYSDGFYGACAASPGPFSPLTGTMYQRYGRYEVRLKFVFKDSRHLDQYHLAFLLWPENIATGCLNGGESDFPEEWLSQDPFHIQVDAYWHYCPGPHTEDHYYRYANVTKWHTYIQEWGPGFRRYYLDRKLVGEATDNPFDGPERWQLQVAAWNQPGDTTRGHLLVDWVWLGKFVR